MNVSMSIELVFIIEGGPGVPYVSPAHMEQFKRGVVSVMNVFTGIIQGIALSALDANTVS